MKTETKPSVTPPVQTVAINNSSEKSTTGGIGESVIKPTPSDKVALTFDTTTAPTTSKFGGGETTKTAETKPAMKVAHNDSDEYLTVADWQKALRVIVLVNGGTLDPEGKTVYKVTPHQVAKAFLKADHNSFTRYRVTEDEVRAFTALRDSYKSEGMSYIDGEGKIDGSASFSQIMKKVDDSEVLEKLWNAATQSDPYQNRVWFSDRDIWKADEDGDLPNIPKYRNPHPRPAERGPYGLNNSLF
jgi:hypothetical protein